MQFEEVIRLRQGCIFFLLVSLSFATAYKSLAQAALQGRSQYGGLLRNVNSQKCIDVFGSATNKNANVQQYSCNGGGNQRWEFIELGNGQYAIRNGNSDLVMDVAGASRGNGANVQQFPWNGGANQRWMTRGPSNNFEIVNVNSGKCLDMVGGGTNANSGKCLDVQGGGNANNTNIVQFDRNGGSNQRWFIGYVH